MEKGSGKEESILAENTPAGLHSKRIDIWNFSSVDKRKRVISFEHNEQIQVGFYRF